MKKTAVILTASLATLLLSSCAADGDLVINSNVGISATRTGCPAVAVPDGTGDITLFNPENWQDASAIDVVATLTKVRSVCNNSGAKIYTEASFQVFASRRDTRGARTVTLPYFSTVVQGSTAVIAKRIGQVTLQFADGQARASTSGKAASYVDAAAARLPADIIAKITKKRKPGDPDAALDPFADPQVKAAVTRASFELLIGFQLTEDQLRYNVTR